MPICYEISIGVDRTNPEGESYETSLPRTITSDNPLDPEALRGRIQEEWNRFVNSIGRYDPARISQYAPTGNFKIISVYRC